MCLAVSSIQLTSLYQEKWKHTRTGDTRSAKARGGVVYHTAVCKVRRLPGRASYRTSESYGPGRYRKETDCMTE